MKNKIVSIVIAFAMVLGLAVPAFAAPASSNANTGPGVAQVEVYDVVVRIGGNGNSARLIAYVDGEQAYVSANRPANNAITTLRFDGFVVAVEVRGNSIIGVNVLETPEPPAHIPTFALNAYNGEAHNGGCDWNESLSSVNSNCGVAGTNENGSFVRIWFVIDGQEGVQESLTPWSVISSISAVDQDGNDVTELVTPARMWIDGVWDVYTNSLDVSKDADWTHMDVTVVAYGQTATVRIFNCDCTAVAAPTFALRSYNGEARNGGCDWNATLSSPNSNCAVNGTNPNGSFVRVWFVLDGAWGVWESTTPWSEIAEISAVDQDGNDVTHLVEPARLWRNNQWDVYTNRVDVSKDADWTHMDVTVVAFGQEATIRIFNCECTAHVPVFRFSGPYNNGCDFLPNLTAREAGGNNEFSRARAWFSLDGVAGAPFAGIESAVDQDGNCALHLLGINRVWNNQSIFTFVDAFKYREWQTITLTVTAYGQTHEVVFKNCECKDVVEPVVVDLGFIGYYFHPSRPESYGPMSTSFFWLTLEEGDIIDWDAVEAAYAGWVAQGGLAPDFATGWHSSGFAPITFNHGAAIGHGDFSFPQLEGFYRAYFVSPGFLLPAYVCSNVCEDCGRNNCATCNECVCVAKLPPVLPPVVPPCDGDDDCDDVIEGDNDDEDYDDGNEGDNDDEDYDNGNEGNKDDEDYDNGNEDNKDDEDYDNGNEGNKDDEDYDNGNNGDDDNNNDQGEDNDEQ